MNPWVTRSLLAGALLAAAAIAYRSARQERPPVPGRVDLAHDRAPRAAGSVAERAPAVQAARASRAPLGRERLATIDGGEFIALLPDLEMRARGGEPVVATWLIERLQACSSYEPESDETVRRRIDESQDRASVLYERMREDARNAPHLSEFEVNEGTRARALRSAFDERDRCTALTARQIEGRVDIAKAALQHHDRDVALALAGLGMLRLSDVELVRNASSLAQLRDLERAELSRLAEAGDLEAITAAARGYSGYADTLLGSDPSAAYAYAYALSLAIAGDESVTMETLMASLAGKGMSPQQVEAARVLGEALHRRCCTHSGSG